MFKFLPFFFCLCSFWLARAREMGEPSIAACVSLVLLIINTRVKKKSTRFLIQTHAKKLLLALEKKKSFATTCCVGDFLKRAIFDNRIICMLFCILSNAQIIQKYTSDIFFIYCDAVTQNDDKIS